MTVAQLDDRLHTMPKPAAFLPAVEPDSAPEISPPAVEPEQVFRAYVIGRGKQTEGGTVCYVLDLPESVMRAHVVERRGPNLRSVIVREMDQELARRDEAGQWER